MAELNTKIVRYDKYCRRCKYWTTKETDDPCDECLTESVRLGTKKPLKFEAKGKGGESNA